MRTKGKGSQGIARPPRLLTTKPSRWLPPRVGIWAASPRSLIVTLLFCAFVATHASTTSQPRIFHHQHDVCSPSKWSPLVHVPEGMIPNVTAGTTTIQAGIVVAYCRHGLDRLWEEAKQLQWQGVNVAAIYIYSKCGKPLHTPPPEGLSRTWRFEELPNVGRNDQTFAQHLAWHAGKDLEDMLIFVKEWAEPHQLKMSEFAPIALRNGLGFSCRFKGGGPDWVQSDWHKTESVAEYAHKYVYVSLSSPARGKSNFISPYRGVLHWLRSLDFATGDREVIERTFKRPLVPVCYRGNFAMLRKNAEFISSDAWGKLAASLSREDNLEEGHFMERTWAAILSEEVPWEGWHGDAEELRRLADSIKNVRFFPGRLHVCRRLPSQRPWSPNRAYLNVFRLPYI